MVESILNTVKSSSLWQKDCKSLGPDSAALSIFTVKDERVTQRINRANDRFVVIFQHQRTSFKHMVVLIPTQ